ncbi:MAG: hypothetical protein ABEH38_01430 [Flavobacteriales bacterium]
MQLIPVDSKARIKAFQKVPWRIYADDPNWVPHLKQDVEAVFDPKKNKCFRHGEAQRWVLLDDRERPIGRVAAFVHYRQNWGGMGFFECINDKQAAFMLFDKCKEWLEERGMDRMDGPINFGEKDKFWGLIIKNFNLPPYYGQNYNPSYYVDLFEAYGFKIYYKQIIFHRNLNDPLQERYRERAERIENNPKYEFRTIDMREGEKYAEDFRKVYNRAWKSHSGFMDMPHYQAKAMLNSFKPIMDENLIWFAYYDGEPVGFYISLPELNEVFAYVNGNLNWWGKLKFYYHKEIRKAIRTSFGVVFGVDPDHQGKGLEGAFFRQLEKLLHEKLKRPYTDLIITWIGDFNPKMIRIIENLGTTRLREMATYRKLFDDSLEFQRAPEVN